MNSLSRYIYLSFLLHLIFGLILFYLFSTKIKYYSIPLEDFKFTLEEVEDVQPVQPVKQAEKIEEKQISEKPIKVAKSKVSSQVEKQFKTASSKQIQTEIKKQELTAEKNVKRLEKELSEKKEFDLSKKIDVQTQNNITPKKAIKNDYVFEAKFDNLREDQKKIELEKKAFNISNANREIQSKIETNKEILTNKKEMLEEKIEGKTTEKIFTKRTFDINKYVKVDENKSEQILKNKNVSEEKFNKFDVSDLNVRTKDDLFIEKQNYSQSSSKKIESDLQKKDNDYLIKKKEVEKEQTYTNIYPENVVKTKSSKNIEKVKSDESTLTQNIKKTEEKTTEYKIGTITGINKNINEPTKEINKSSEYQRENKSNIESEYLYETKNIKKVSVQEQETIKVNLKTTQKDLKTKTEVGKYFEDNESQSKIRTSQDFSSKEVTTAEIKGYNKSIKEEVINIARNSEINPKSSKKEFNETNLVESNFNKIMSKKENVRDEEKISKIEARHSTEVASKEKFDNVRKDLLISSEEKIIQKIKSENKTPAINVNVQEIKGETKKYLEKNVEIANMDRNANFGYETKSGKNIETKMSVNTSNRIPSSNIGKITESEEIEGSAIKTTKLSKRETNVTKKTGIEKSKSDDEYGYSLATKKSSSQSEQIYDSDEVKGISLSSRVYSQKEIGVNNYLQVEKEGINAKSGEGKKFVVETKIEEKKTINEIERKKDIGEKIEKEKVFEEIKDNKEKNVNELTKTVDIKNLGSAEARYTKITQKQDVQHDAGKKNIGISANYNQFEINPQFKERIEKYSNELINKNLSPMIEELTNILKDIYKTNEQKKLNIILEVNDDGIIKDFSLKEELSKNDRVKNYLITELNKWKKSLNLPVEKRKKIYIWLYFENNNLIDKKINWLH
ncbi:MAG TPA: hypothetical protein PLD27_01670 [bacterium]|nr:hypothetical protein [bacterium]HPQ18436.1 hypothetical protein [bacterium]